MTPDPDKSWIYLDNAATTRPDAAVLAAMQWALQEGFANPSARHTWGMQVRDAIDDARARIADAVGISPDGVIFTSGATEANNLAASGFPLRSGTRRAITSPAEHASLLGPMQRHHPHLDFVRITSDGIIDLDHFADLLGDDVGLVALYEGHNEIGSVNPTHEIARLVQAKAPRAFLHMDTVQSIGRPDMPGFSSGVTSASVSAHKIHGPKGIGALLVDTRSPLQPQIIGGGQERGLRGGTENVPGILGFAVAMQQLANKTAAEHEALSQQKATFSDEIVHRIAGTRALGATEHSLPHILSIVFDGALGEVILHHLEMQGVLASTGAACQAAKREVSPALRALGLSSEEVRSTVRFSFSKDTTCDEVKRVLELLPPIVEKVRRLGGRP